MSIHDPDRSTQSEHRPNPFESGHVGSGETAAGQQLYQETCAAWHASNAEGVDGFGTALAGNAFIQSMTNATLVAFIAVGRPASDPDNTTGNAVPAKGGNSALTDQDLTDIVEYPDTIQ
jgi:mono/diheme cytochrome c family protein